MRIAADRRLVWTLLLALLLASAGGRGLAAAERLPDGLFVLRLQRLLHQHPDSWQDARDCFIEIQRREGRWLEQVWGYAPSYNKAEHHGQISLVQEPKTGGASLDLELQVQADEWVPGGKAVLHLDLKPGKRKGTWTGTYFGKFRQQPVHGLVNVFPRGVPPTLSDLAIESGVHPRVLLRQEQLDRLRQAAATPSGQAVLEGLRRKLQEPVVWHQFAANAGAHAAGHALLFALTGAETSAAKAQELVWERMRKQVGGPPLLAEAAEVVGVALAYDLCHDVWEPAFRAMVTAWLETKAKALARAEALVGKVDAHQSANVITRSAALLASLAIYKDQGRYPQRPGQAVHQRIAPDKQFRPDGDQGEDWADDQMPRKWLVAGPFFSILDEDVLEGLGGSIAARPRLADVVSFEGRDRPFRRMKKEWFYTGDGSGGKPALDLLAPVERAYHTLACYYTAIHVDKDRLVRFDLGNSHAVRARAYLAGVPIQNGDFLDLKKGWYPLLIRTEVGATQPWGVIWMRPRFKAVDRKKLKTLHERGSAAIEAWQEGYAKWADSGRQVVSAADSIERSLRHLRRYLLHGIGEQGLATSGDAAQVAGARALLPAMAAWRSCSKGGQLSDGAVGMHLIFGLAARLAKVDGRVVLPGMGRGDHVLRDPNLFALGLPELPLETYVQVTDLLAKVDAEIFRGGSDPVADIFSFLYTPTVRDIESLPSPAQVVLDRRQGVLVHRGGLFNGTDLVAMLQIGNAEWGAPIPINDAGALRLTGLGHRWLVGGGSAGDNVVLVQDAVRSGHGRLLAHERFGRDNSGSVTRIDLSACYQDKNHKPLKVTAQRQLLIDYEAGEGTDMVMVCYDNVLSDRQRTWQLNVVGDIVVHGNSFTVTPERLDSDEGEAIPTGPQRHLSGQILYPKQAKPRVHGKTLRILGEDRFLVVLTVHSGKAPVAAWVGDAREQLRIGEDYLVDFSDDRLEPGGR